MVTISLHYWAGAKAAAGVAMERFEAETIRGALEQAQGQRSDPRFDRVLSVSTLLVDGLTVHQEALDQPVERPVEVEILPPFAGGSGSFTPLERANRGATARSFV